ncbi:MAG: hypothetical protein E7207_07625 [Clostridium butyricum]|nr:hypothetical protein [Clostridium butyricum]
MRERKNIKLRTDMYEDTKFKIIDTMVERDTINYIWTRLLTLCGKVNDIEGRLFVTKNKPYTIEILAIEFNRTIEQIENAINVFIDLNMIAKDVNGTLKIINWCKYQGNSKNNKNCQESNEIHEKVKQTKSYKEVKNKDKENAIEITDTNLVKDKVEKEEQKCKPNLDIKKKKTKLKKKKNSVRNNYSDIIEEDEMENEIIEFTEPMPISDDCRRIAVFDFT